MSVARDVETRGDEDAGRYDLLAQYGGQPHMMKRIGELYLSRRHHVFWTHIMSDSRRPSSTIMNGKRIQIYLIIVFSADHRGSRF